MIVKVSSQLCRLLSLIVLIGTLEHLDFHAALSSVTVLLHTGWWYWYTSCQPLLVLQDCAGELMVVHSRPFGLLAAAVPKNLSQCYKSHICYLTAVS